MCKTWSENKTDPNVIYFSERSHHTPTPLHLSLLHSSMAPLSQFLPKGKVNLTLHKCLRRHGGSIDAYCHRQQRQVQAQKVPSRVQEELPRRHNR